MPALHLREELYRLAQAKAEAEGRTLEEVLEEALREKLLKEGTRKPLPTYRGTEPFDLTPEAIKALLAEETFPSR